MPPVSPFPSAAPSPVYSVQALADAVNRWCEEHGITPANGQAAEKLTDRNVRYYRARGLLDAPGDGGNRSGSDASPAAVPSFHRRGFTEKHLAQLRLIRLFQARGLPLSHIEQQIRGRSMEELQALERRELHKPAPTPATAANGHSAGYPHGHPGAGQEGNGGGSSAPIPLLREGQEHWLVSALSEDFLLVSRRGLTLSDEQRRLLIALLHA